MLYWLLMTNALTQQEFILLVVVITIWLLHIFIVGEYVHPSHKIISVKNFQKVDTGKLEEIFMCDDIWDDVMSSFDNISDCVVF